MLGYGVWGVLVVGKGASLLSTMFRGKLPWESDRRAKS